MRRNSSDKASANVRIMSVLAKPGHAHQQAMPAGEHRHQQFLDHLLLADDHAAQLFGDEAIGFVEFMDGLDVVFVEHDGKTC